MQTFWKKSLSRPAIRAMLLLLLGMGLSLALSPALRADALEAVSGVERVSVLTRVTTVPAERVLVMGETGADTNTVLAEGRRVTLIHGESEEYATTRAGERVSELLRRLRISLEPMELVLVDLRGDEVTVEVGSELTCYETVSESVAHTTQYTTTSRLPKGETEVYQVGVDGTRDVTYELTYSCGQLVSRQAVAEENNTSVPELAYLGTRVEEAQEGDTIASVVYEADGGGYLVMASGDTLHFVKAVEVRCTAYTAGYDGVDTCTATGTTVRRGVVAADKRVFPLGSKLYVDIKSDAFEYGMAYVEDTGMRGEKLDLYMDSYDECIQFGVRKAVAYLLG